MRGMLTRRSAPVLLLMGVSSGFFGCTHSIHQYHVSDFEPLTKGNASIIESKAEQFTVLGFVGNTDFVDQAFRGLERQCPRGRVSAITTEHLTHHGFFSWTNEVIMTGRCVSQ